MEYLNPNRSAAINHIRYNGFMCSWVNGFHAREGIMQGMRPFQYRWNHAPTGKSGIDTVYCIDENTFRTWLDAMNGVDLDWTRWMTAMQTGKQYMPSNKVWSYRAI